MKKYFRKPYKIKRKKSIFKNRFFWLGILVLFVFTGIFYLVCFCSFFQMEKIFVSGEKKVSKEKIKIKIEQGLENKILFLKTKSIFLVNLNKIREDILNNFPRLGEVEIKRVFPDVLNIVVVERLSLAKWCQEEQCFLLDNEGVIFEETPLETDLIKIVDKKNTVSFALRERVIEKDYFETIFKIKNKLLDELKIEAKEFIVFTEHLNIKTTEGWEIYFNPKGNIDWQLTKLKAVLEEEIPLEKTKDLEHIDLRFGNFAPYKYRD